MICTNLNEALQGHLADAIELSVAVALMNEEGFKFIQTAINSTCTQHYLVGIDLPTPPALLQLLKEKESNNFLARIYKSQASYHPKVYLIKKAAGFISIIGSANATT